MIENKFKVEMTEQQRAFFLGVEWRDCGKPFLEKILQNVKDRAISFSDEPNEWMRLQGEARRIKVFLDLDVMLRQSLQDKEK